MAPKTRIFRISEIPQVWSTDNVRQVFEAHNIACLCPVFHLLPSCINPGTYTTIVALDPAAPSLAKVLKDPLSSDLLPFGDHSLVVDQNFYGLTTLACPSLESEIKAE